MGETTRRPRRGDDPPPGDGPPATGPSATGRTLGHFACFRLGAPFWELPPTDRGKALRVWAAGARSVPGRTSLYQLYPTRAEADLLVWAAAMADDPAAPDELFRELGRAAARARRWLEPGLTFWGLTRPSPYVREASKTAIDPLADERARYLVVYPFVKTHDWFRLDLDRRRELMGEHIRVGRRHGDVRQLLLYSFGLQDQDFVVVYETPDLALFSDLVHELRATEARAYTARDTPILTGVRRTVDDLVEMWC